MRWTRWMAASLASLSLILTYMALSCTRKAPPQMDQAAKVKRGAYLTAIAGCTDCHTPGFFYNATDSTRLLSGSELGWQGPWGVTYARNLTPDNETGIGAWSEAEIVTAIRTGRRPDGSTILPPMPWVDFAYLTDDDAYAIAAYLKSIPPVVHKVPDRLPPGAKGTGSIIVWPPPSAWDAPRSPAAAGAPPADTTAH